MSILQARIHKKIEKKMFCSILNIKNIIEQLILVNFLEQTMNVLNLSGDQIRQMPQEQLKAYCNYILNSGQYVPPDRNAQLLEDIDDWEDICKANWKKCYDQNIANHLTSDSATLPDFAMGKAGEEIARYFKCISRKSKEKCNFRILDSFAGNGIASKIIHDEIRSGLVQSKKNEKYEFRYIATDIQEELNKKLTLRSFNVEFPLDCIQAIEKYQDSNVLLIVSPPPSSWTPDGNEGSEPTGFADYFAVKKWTELNKPILIMIGEIGLSDGTKGMYQFMMNHKNWKLYKRSVLAAKNDLFGNYVQKEIFIFENKEFSSLG